jgi:transposase
MTHDDLIYRHRLRLFARAGEVGVSRACRELGFHRSTYYRWKARVEREGLAILRPRERRPPRMPNQTPVWVEERIVALALAMPGLGARRLAAQLAQPGWGGLRVSASGVAKVLARRGLSTRRRRLSLVAGYASPPGPPEQPSGPERREPLPVRHLDATQPGDLVGFDCFHIGRLSGTKGRVWQYTAIDVASSYVWAEVHVTPLNPSSVYTAGLVERVAAELAKAGWQLGAVLSDNGSEFRSGVFRQAGPRPAGSGPYWCQAAVHPGRPPADERERRARAAHHPGGVLAADLRPLTGAQVHRPGPRPQSLSGLLQPRAGPHRPPHPGPHSGPDRLRFPKDPAPMNEHECRHNSWTVQPRARPSARRA